MKEYTDEQKRQLMTYQLINGLQSEEIPEKLYFLLFNNLLHGTSIEGTFPGNEDLGESEYKYKISIINGKKILLEIIEVKKDESGLAIRFETEWEIDDPITKRSLNIKSNFDGIDSCYSYRKDPFYKIHEEYCGGNLIIINTNKKDYYTEEEKQILNGILQIFFESQVFQTALRKALSYTFVSYEEPKLYISINKINQEVCFTISLNINGIRVSLILWKGEATLQYVEGSADESVMDYVRNNDKQPKVKELLEVISKLKQLGIEVQYKSKHKLGG